MKCLLALFHLYLLVIIAFLNVSAKKCGGKPGGVIGGTKAKRGELPWQVLVSNYESGGMCGGTIVSPRHVITAGHCITDRQPNATRKTAPDQLDVFAGMLNMQKIWIDPDVQHIPVKEIHSDDKWVPHRPEHELVVLTMQSNFTWTDTVQPMRPANKKDNHDLAGEKILVSGWGNIDHYGNDGTGSDDLLWANMVVADKCTYNFAGKEGIFCGMGTKGENVCSGDSGGPAICVDKEGKKYLCGFSSMGRCDRGQGAFGRVSLFADFIKKAMSKP